ncbi:hypothetical protein DSO57_1029598 [Entomophthora muscae]|uniref:Uncharacterized protein n=1 Tax=Entomophthora muscae TaxID=34485 RepID=A0ACC2TND9_9FUNG|nr:hypothetical protein DSO57_1029598 [Entomophthora muscae]
MAIASLIMSTTSETDRIHTPTALSDDRFREWLSPRPSLNHDRFKGWNRGHLIFRRIFQKGVVPCRNLSSWGGAGLVQGARFAAGDLAAWLVTRPGMAGYRSGSASFQAKGWLIHLPGKYGIYPSLRFHPVESNSTPSHPSVTSQVCWCILA